MATFRAQIISLVGETPVQSELDTWCLEAVKEIAMQLPASMLEKCSDKSTLNSGTPGTSDQLDLSTATVGKVLYCTRNNATYDIPCRLVSSADAHLTEDSTNTNLYATTDDPAYYIRDNILEIRPLPTNAQPGKVYHIVYPASVDADVDSAVANFPNEAEHLVVLYAAMKQLENYMSDEVTNEDPTLYGLFADKYAKIAGEYIAGVTILKGG